MLSVITPVLNGAAFIENNIRAVQALKIPFEHIIVDGGSSDDTIKIIKRYPHINLIFQSEENGMYGAIHEGICQAKGKFISYLNADDIYLNGFERLFKKAVEANADLVYGNAIFNFIEANKLKKFYPALAAGYFLKRGLFPICQSSTIFSIEAYEKVGGFRSDIFKVCGDLDLFQRIAFLQETKIIFVPVFASEFMMHKNSLGSISKKLYEREYKKLKTYKGRDLSIRLPAKLMRLLAMVVSKLAT
jgi:glycosyltransferase involved in cell wall biosynthesis